VAVLGRTPAQFEVAYWAGLLSAGHTRASLVSSFTDSPEFGRLVSGMGGGGTTAPPLQNTQQTANPPAGDSFRTFSTHLYVGVLGRQPAENEINYWANRLRNGVETGSSIAYFFFFSPEMTNRGLNNEQYARTLYQALFNRIPADNETAYWTRQLNNGISRYNVFVSFITSEEFIRLCSSYGIQLGTVPPHTQIATGDALAGKTIFLDPGHGTSGSPGSGGYNEAVAMLALARRIRVLLQEHGATVILTRDHEVNTPLSVRSARINIHTLEVIRSTHTNPTEVAEINRLISQMQSIVNSNGANENAFMNINPHRATRVAHPDMQRIFAYQNNPVIRNNFLLISLHSNATQSGRDDGVRGAEVYYSDSNVGNLRTYFTGYSYAAESSRFGDRLLNNIASIGIPRRSNGLRAMDMAITRESNIPAVLAENGYHTSASDRMLLMDAGFMERLAQAYLNTKVAHYR
jgi:N-acetylmuramoyl-L-alanine amidase